MPKPEPLKSVADGIKLVEPLMKDLVFHNVHASVVMVKVVAAAKMTYVAVKLRTMDDSVVVAVVVVVAVAVAVVVAVEYVTSVAGNADSLAA